MQPSSNGAGREIYRILAESYSGELPSPVTKSWLANFMMGLAERYDHSAIDKYRKDIHRERGASESCGAPILMRYASVADVREGHYQRGAAELLSGFVLLNDLEKHTADGEEGESFLLDRLDLSQTLANILIDMNMPEYAIGVTDDMKDAMTTHLRRADSRDWDFREYKRLDAASRAAFRMGKDEGLYPSIHAMTEKRKQSRNLGEDGQRELAWLVLMSAWLPESMWRHDPDHRENALEAINQASTAVKCGLAAQYSGNDDWAYLARALAALSWRGPESPINDSRELLASLLKSRPPPKHVDPGPWGFTVGYLAASTSGPVAERARELWGYARHGLLYWEYKLEVAGLDALRPGREDEALEALEAFHKIRRQVVGELAPVLDRLGLIQEKGALMEDACRERENVERRTIKDLPEKTDRRRELLLNAGLAPM
jgi:hypothetical protein